MKYLQFLKPRGATSYQLDGIHSFDAAMHTLLPELRLMIGQDDGSDVFLPDQLIGKKIDFDFDQLAELPKQHPLPLTLPSIISVKDHIVSHNFRWIGDEILAVDADDAQPGLRIVAGGSCLQLDTANGIYVLITHNRATDAGAKQPANLQNPIVMMLLQELAFAVMGKIKDKAQDAVADYFLNQFFPTENDFGIRRELVQIQAKLDRIAADIKFQKSIDFEDVLIHSRTWLRDSYPHFQRSYFEGQAVVIGEPLTEIARRQTNLQDILSVLETRINKTDLETCDDLERFKVWLYASCALLRIIYFKEQLFLEKMQSLDGVPTNFISHYKEFVDKVPTYGKTIELYLSALWEGRQKLISKAEGTYETHGADLQLKLVYITVKTNIRDKLISKMENDPMKADNSNDMIMERVVSTHEQAKQSVDGQKWLHDTSYNNNITGLFDTNVRNPLNEALEAIKVESSSLPGTGRSPMFIDAFDGPGDLYDSRELNYRVNEVQYLRRDSKARALIAECGATKLMVIKAKGQEMSITFDRSTKVMKIWHYDIIGWEEREIWTPPAPKRKVKVPITKDIARLSYTPVIRSTDNSKFYKFYDYVIEKVTLTIQVLPDNNFGMLIVQKLK